MNCERNICYQQEYNGGCDTCPCNRTTKEAIENLKKLKSFHNGSYGSSIRIAIEALEKQATSDYISEWIPVSERLPNINGIVLVQRGKYAECKGKPIIDIAKFTNRKTGFFEREKGFYQAWYSMPFKYDDVIAWMPCPEPYKGE